jgi:hypothetical protein
MMIVIIFHELLFDNESVKACIKNLDDIWVSTFSQNIDFSKKAFQAFFFIYHILYSHYLYSHLLFCLYINSKFHFSVSPFSDCLYNLILVIQYSPYLELLFFLLIFRYFKYTIMYWTIQKCSILNRVLCLYFGYNTVFIQRQSFVLLRLELIFLLRNLGLFVLIFALRRIWSFRGAFIRRNCHILALCIQRKCLNYFIVHLVIFNLLFI